MKVFGEGNRCTWKEGDEHEWRMCIPAHGSKCGDTDTIQAAAAAAPEVWGGTQHVSYAKHLSYAVFLGRTLTFISI